MFDTFIINLEQDKDKLDSIVNKLRNIGIDPLRFNAVYGKTVDPNNYRENIIPWLVPFIPRSILGIALSHITLCGWLYHNDPNEYALILEDDAIPLVKDKSEIEAAISRVPKDWDIILLHYFGNYSPNDIHVNTFTGSGAAYLINKRGQDKFRRLKAVHHIDIHRNLRSDIKTYKTPVKLFGVDDSFESSNTTDTCASANGICQKISETFFVEPPKDMLNYKLIRVPGSGYELNAKEVLFLLVFVSLTLYVCIRKKRILIYSLLFTLLLLLIIYLLMKN